jgi:hypothetical protein
MMTEDEVRFLEVPFQRLTVKPDEVILIKYPGRLTKDAHANVVDSAKRAFGTQRVVVLDVGMEVNVVKVEEKDDNGNS